MPRFSPTARVTAGSRRTASRRRTGGASSDERPRERQAPDEARALRPFRQARAAVGDDQRDGRAQASGVRERREQDAPQQPLARRARVQALDLLARVLDQQVVAHARRAGRHAGHAAEAVVEVADHRVRQDAVLLQPLAHQHDPAARRVHLLVPEHVRRARRQAEAAVHAVLDQVDLGRLVGVEGGHSDPAHEDAGVARARGVEARLDAAHQDDAPGPRRDPTGRGGRAPRRARRARRRATARAPCAGARSPSRARRARPPAARSSAGRAPRGRRASRPRPAPRRRRRRARRAGRRRARRRRRRQPAGRRADRAQSASSSSVVSRIEAESRAAAPRRSTPAGRPRRRRSAPARCPSARPSARRAPAPRASCRRARSRPAAAAPGRRSCRSPSPARADAGAAARRPR